MSYCMRVLILAFASLAVVLWHRNSASTPNTKERRNPLRNPTAMKTALVVGANRGIGLNLVKALAAQNWTVVGSIRPQTRADPSVKELEDTGAKVLEIDYLDEKTIITAAAAYGPGPLDVLINCAGVGPEPDSWHEHTAEIFMNKLRTNTIGPFLTSKHFHPNLKKAAGAIINISSNLASITENNAIGEDLGYRVSKTALNQLSVTMAREFQAAGDNIAVLALYPGYLPTKMTNYRSRNDMKECIEGMVKIIQGVDMTQTGRFVNWKNETLPW